MWALNGRWHSHLLVLSHLTTFLGWCSSCHQEYIRIWYWVYCVSLCLGNISKELDIRDRYLLEILMVASKKVITRRCLLKEPLTLNRWIDIINNIYSMERMTFSLRWQKEQGEEWRAKWDTYLSNEESNNWNIKVNVNESVPFCD